LPTVILKWFGSAMKNVKCCAMKSRKWKGKPRFPKISWGG